MRAPWVARSRYEAELSSLALRWAAATEAAASARTERDEALGVADALSSELQRAEPELRRRLEEVTAANAKLGARCLRQAIAIERLEHDLAMAAAAVDATTWGWEPPRSETS